MPRPQFTLRALLVAILVVGAFLGGITWQRTSDDRQRMNDDRERDLLEWRVKVLTEDYEALKQELRSTMFDLMKAEAKLKVHAQNAETAAE